MLHSIKKLFGFTVANTSCGDGFWSLISTSKHRENLEVSHTSLSLRIPKKFFLSHHHGMLSKIDHLFQNIIFIRLVTVFFFFLRKGLSFRYSFNMFFKIYLLTFIHLKSIFVSSIIFVFFTVLYISNVFTDIWFHVSFFHVSSW